MKCYEIRLILLRCTSSHLLRDLLVSFQGFRLWDSSAGSPREVLVPLG